jgi:predicted RNase H-like HicB family nuclease
MRQVDPAHGAWVVECPAMLGCVSQVNSKEQTFANIKGAIAACLEVRAERGKPLTIDARGRS